MVGIVDGLNMNKLFSEKQAVPTTTSLTGTTGNYLASIATSMLATVSGVISKNAANHADADKEETIDYNDIPIDVWERCALDNHPNKIIAMGYMKAYHDDLTIDQHGAKQKWRTVEYPVIESIK